MKNIIRTITILLLASLACSFSPFVAPTNFPEVPASLTASPESPTQTPLPTATLPAPTAVPLPATITPTSSAKPVTMSDEQIRNAALAITGSDQVQRTIAFVNGEYTQSANASDTSTITIKMGEIIAHGDLNNDGLEDAAITVHENYGGTGVFAMVVAILNSNGIPSAAGSMLIDDRPIINGLTIKNGEILLDAVVHGPGDPACCAAQVSRRNYRLVDNNLVLTKLTSQNPGGVERVIEIESPSSGSEISGTVLVKGAVTVSPFENTLVYRIFSAGSANPVEQAGFTISADGMGGPGTFELPLDFAQKGLTGPVWIEIYDTSPADGSTIALASFLLIVK